MYFCAVKINRLTCNWLEKMKVLHNKVDRRLLKERLEKSNEQRITLSFYQYAKISNPELFRNHLFLLLDECQVLGRVYVASEGVNGQLSVLEERYEDFKKALNTVEFLKDIRLNVAIEDDGKSFFKLTIKVRNKIVADGLEDETFDVTDKGVHLDAESFNKLTELQNTVVVDMRNHYESEVGHFKGAILPDVETFREALPVVVDMLEDKKDQNVIMYCTGGIRCEKASAYMKHNGFQNVYQVEGGIIEYARQVEEKGLENKYIGKNFVFDERLGERISEEVIAKCHQCGTVCDAHANCANNACHILFIQCESCAAKYKACCSVKCAEYNELPEEKRDELRKVLEFNGTKFGKGRYKAHKKDEKLEIEGALLEYKTNA